MRQSKDSKASDKASKPKKNAPVILGARSKGGDGDLSNYVTNKQLDDTRSKFLKELEEL